MYYTQENLEFLENIFFHKTFIINYLKKYLLSFRYPVQPFLYFSSLYIETNQTALLSTHDISENELVSLCIAKNRNAQQMLFEKYKKAMFTKVFRLLNDYDEANDALQEGFIEVFRSLPDFRADATLGAWIKTIMVRQAIRRRAILSKFESFDDQIHEVAFEAPDSFSVQELDEAIRGLPEGCRTVFLLAEVEGYMHKEITEMLQISEGTSKSQLSYAKKLLRKKLTNA